MKTRTASGSIRVVRHAQEDDDLDEQIVVAVTDEGSISNTNDDPPPLKKRRQSRSTGASSKDVGSSINNSKGASGVKIYRGRNVGKLAMLLKMPIDIFCEISVYMEPLDLLHLARSSRSFNEMLMSRNSKPIWRMARSYYADLPDCPPDLSEPAYARLVFEKDCHECLAPRALKVDYILRVRLCHRCRSPNIMRGTQLLKTMPGLTRRLLECVPCRQRQYRQNRSSQYFYVASVKALVAKFYSTIPKSLPKKEAEVLQQEFYERNKKIVKDVAKHADDVEHWVSLDRVAKHLSGMHAARRREASLRAKLVDLGHNEDDFPTSWSDEEWNKIMTQPRDLTPRIWENVRPKLEACIQRASRIRAEKSRNSRRKLRKAELSQIIQGVIIAREKQNKDLLMSETDVFLLPGVNALLEKDDYGLQITQETWDSVWDQIEKEMDEFADSSREFLLGLIRASINCSGQGSTSDVHGSPLATPSVDDEADSDRDMAALRAAYFQCNCFQLHYLKYPALLNHTQPIKEVTYDSVGTKCANLLLASCSGEYQEEYLFTLGPQLRCVRCGEASAFMTWSSLIKHFAVEQEWYEEELLRQQIDPSIKVTLYNDHALDDHTPAFTVGKFGWGEDSEYPDLYCGLCRWSRQKPRTRKEVESHIRRNHLKDPEPGHVKQYDFSQAFYDYHGF